MFLFIVVFRLLWVSLKIYELRKNFRFYVQNCKLEERGMIRHSIFCPFKTPIYHMYFNNTVIQIFTTVNPTARMIRHFLDRPKLIFITVNPTFFSAELSLSTHNIFDEVYYLISIYSFSIS